MNGEPHMYQRTNEQIIAELVEFRAVLVLGENKGPERRLRIISQSEGVRGLGWLIDVGYHLGRERGEHGNGRHRNAAIQALDAAIREQRS